MTEHNIKLFVMFRPLNAASDSVDNGIHDGVRRLVTDDVEISILRVLTREYNSYMLMRMLEENREEPDYDRA